MPAVLLSYHVISPSILQEIGPSILMVWCESCSIVHINSTRVDLSLAGGLAEWITVAASRLKEWAGLAGLALCLILISVLAFWCMCHMQFKQRRTQALMIQAFAAVETGQSPQVWLGMLEK